MGGKQLAEVFTLAVHLADPHLILLALLVFHHFESMYSSFLYRMIIWKKLANKNTAWLGGLLAATTPCDNETDRIDPCFFGIL